MKQIFFIAFILHMGINASESHTTPSFYQWLHASIKDSYLGVSFLRKSSPEIRVVCDTACCAVGTLCLSCSASHPCCCVAGTALIAATAYNNQHLLKGLITKQPTIHPKKDL